MMLADECQSSPATDDPQVRPRYDDALKDLQEQAQSAQFLLTLIGGGSYKAAQLIP